MALVTGVTINGNDLSVTYGMLISTLTGWAGLTPLTFPSLPIPGVSGETVIGPYVETPRRVNLKGWVVGTSVADARAKLDALQIALVPGLTVRLSTQDYSTRELAARILDVNIDGGGAVLLARKIPISIDFLCHDPFWYDLSATSVVLQSSAATSAPTGSGISKPVQTVSGASTNPIFRLYMPDQATIIGSLSITVTTIGGDTLIVDHAAKTVKKNGTSILGSITSGDFFVMDPAVTSDPRPYVSSGTGTHVYKKAWR